MARLTVHVQPRASRSAIAGWRQDALRVRLTAPPVEGAANKALTDFLADVLGARRADISLVAGHTSRTKVVDIAGMADDELARRLAAVMPAEEP